MIDLERQHKCLLHISSIGLQPIFGVTRLVYYRPQGKVMFSQASVILSTIGLMDTRSLLILVTARSVCILLECFLVMKFKHFNQSDITNDITALTLMLSVNGP